MYTDERKQELRQAVVKNVSIAGVLRSMGLRLAGGGYAIVRKYIKEMDLDTSHFLGQSHWKGKSLPCNKQIPLSEILINGSLYQSSKLAKRLLKEGFFTAQCSRCKGTAWQGQPIPLELDHINGDREDHRIENLRFLCSNCHALTSTYRGRNIHVEPKQHLCATCGCMISEQSKSGMCIRCVKKTTCFLAKKFKFNASQMKQAIREVQDGVRVSAVADSLGVSGTTVKRWVKRYNATSRIQQV